MTHVIRQRPNSDKIQWRKSSKSANWGPECVEAGLVDDDSGCVAVRHSLDPNGPIIVYTREEWVAFTRGVCEGEFDFH